MIVTNTTALFPVDMCIPLSAGAATYTASTRTVTGTFTAYVFNAGDVFHCNSSTSSLLPPGDYYIQSGSTSALILAPFTPNGTPLPTVDAVAVAGYIYPNRSSTAAGGGTTTTGANSCMFDAPFTIVDGYYVVAVAAETVSIMKQDGSTVIDSFVVPATATTAQFYPLGGPNGRWFPGGLSAKCSASTLSIRLQFRRATQAECSGAFPVGN